MPTIPANSVVAPYKKGYVTIYSVSTKLKTKPSPSM